MLQFIYFILGLAFYAQTAHYQSTTSSQRIITICEHIGKTWVFIVKNEIKWESLSKGHERPCGTSTHHQNLEKRFAHLSWGIGYIY